MRLRPLVVGGFAASVGLAVACGSQPDNTCSNAAALTVCPDGLVVQGIDVSKYQGTVDWAAAKKGGVQFAIARVSDGLGYPDATFVPNWDGMKQQGIVRGVYQFFRASQDPVQQADYMLGQMAKAGALPNDLPPVMDIETADGVSTNAVRKAMATWLDYVAQKVGRKPMIYTANFMSSILGSGFTGYPLWVANYGAKCPLMPTGWTAWIFWQYDDKGTVKGVGTAGGLDMDEFNGTLGDLLAFANPPAPDAGAPEAGDASPGGLDASTYHPAGPCGL